MNHLIDHNIGIPDDVKVFAEMIKEHRYDFVTLAYLIFGYGQPGHENEKKAPYDWQLIEWQLMSDHLNNPETRYETYRLAISTGNGSGKSAFLAQTSIMLLYTNQLRGRITANTAPQLATVVWPEFDKWLRMAKFNEYFFEKLGTSIKALDNSVGERWRIDQFNWDVNNPSRISGLHNEGHATLYGFEEAAGIPYIVYDYASGAFTDQNTIKFWIVVGNSDDPDSQFEKIMTSPLWRGVRIDTRTLPHVDKKQIADWLKEYGSEDSDEFRIRVRGLPRKAAADSIIGLEAVLNAIENGKKFDVTSVKRMPSILTCDPAWQGGDETTIWHHQGPYSILLERYKLDKDKGQDHKYTYDRLCYWEQTLRADRVLIDQGEGTAIKSFANMDGKYHWELISFASNANDAPTYQESEYQNIRAQMFYEANKALVDGHVIKSRKEEWLPDIQKQLCWTKGKRNDKSLKKQAQSKQEIKEFYGSSPDLADGFVLQFARKVYDRLPENQIDHDGYGFGGVGSNAIVMPESTVDYDQEYDVHY